MLAELMGMSRQAVGGRWTGRSPWTIDEVDSLEMIFGLAPGTLMARAVVAMYPEKAMVPALVGGGHLPLYPGRDSNPGPTD